MCHCLYQVLCKRFPQDPRPEKDNAYANGQAQIVAPSDDAISQEQQLIEERDQKHATSKNGLCRPLSLLLRELWPIC